MYIFMANFKMRANTCTYFKNGGPLASSAQNIDILSGSNRSECNFGFLFTSVGPFISKVTALVIDTSINVLNMMV